MNRLWNKNVSFHFCFAVEHLRNVIFSWKKVCTNKKSFEILYTPYTQDKQKSFSFFAKPQWKEDGVVKMNLFFTCQNLWSHFQALYCNERTHSRCDDQKLESRKMNSAHCTKNLSKLSVRGGRSEFRTFSVGKIVISILVLGENEGYSYTSYFHKVGTPFKS